MRQVVAWLESALFRQNCKSSSRLSWGLTCHTLKAGGRQPAVTVCSIPKQSNIHLSPAFIHHLAWLLAITKSVLCILYPSGRHDSSTSLAALFATQNNTVGFFSCLRFHVKLQPAIKSPHTDNDIILCVFTDLHWYILLLKFIIKI